VQHKMVSLANYLAALVIVNLRVRLSMHTALPRYNCRLMCDCCLAVRAENVPLSMSNLLRTLYDLHPYV
jgi:hypothetical protein